MLLKNIAYNKKPTMITKNQWLIYHSFDGGASFLSIFYKTQKKHPGKVNFRDV